MWGRCYIPGSGKLYGRFLGSRASIAHKRVYFVPHTELSSAAGFSLPLHYPWSAAGSPWQRPIAVWRGTPLWLWAPGGRAVQENGQGHLTWGGVSPEEGSTSSIPMTASGSCRNKEQQSWVGHALSSLLKPDYLQTPWLTLCPSSASAMVGSKISSGLWVQLSVSPPWWKSASSFPVAATGSAAGRLRWGCVGKALRLTPGSSLGRNW